MLIQRQPNRWSCLPTAFAIAVEMPVAKIIEMLGHDGSRHVFPGAKRPEQSFHIMELSLLALRLGYSMTPIFETQVTKNRETGETFTHLLNLDSLIRGDLRDYRGIITGIFPGGPHAVAYESGIIYDPNGATYPLDSVIIDIEQFWVIREA